MKLVFLSVFMAAQPTPTVSRYPTEVPLTLLPNGTVLENGMPLPGATILPGGVVESGGTVVGTLTASPVSQTATATSAVSAIPPPTADTIIYQNASPMSATGIVLLAVGCVLLLCFAILWRRKRDYEVSERTVSVAPLPLHDAAKSSLPSSSPAPSTLLPPAFQLQIQETVANSPSDGRICVVKYSQKTAIAKIALTEQQARAIEHESQLLALFNSPFVIKKLAYLDGVEIIPELPTTRAIIVEWTNLATLSSLLEAKNPIVAQHRNSISLSIARGLEALHSEGMVHLNMTESSVFLHHSLDRGLETKIGNLGHARVQGTLTDQIHGYAPLEAMYSMRIAPAHDIFSLGIVMAHLALLGAAQPPVESGETIELLKTLEVQKPLRELVLACVADDPNDRPAASQVIDSLSIMDEVNWNV
ncbi:hypothetical protein HDU91_001443 [Kappamyces sp. JEL0680]|nr:hypothetical protein HDU91_001443 [Kappamyces sp. JEL0680]